MGLDPPASDTIILREVNLIRGDTLPSRLVQVEAMDSLLIRLGFDDFMDAEGSFDSVQVQIAPQLPPLVDSTQAVEVVDTADLGKRYETMCDPRLNARQGIELAFRVAELLN